MHRAIALIVIGLVGAAFQGGCTPPPPRVPVPAATPGNLAVSYQHDQVKPMPATPQDEPRPRDVEKPPVTKRPPEQGAFVEAYGRVGYPRIAVWVNRTLEGQLVPASSGGSSAGQESYLRPGQYDAQAAGSIDYDAIERLLTDVLAADGQVTILSPAVARQKLTAEQVKDLEAGKSQALGQIDSALSADVLVQVQMRLIRQTPQGLEGRLVAEAINTRGGASIGRALIDCPPPLDQTKLNDCTREVLRKLMNDLTASWKAMAAMPPAPATEGTGSATTKP